MAGEASLCWKRSEHLFI